jgi:GNAT superfamily N-acetyltransferase
VITIREAGPADAPAMAPLLAQLGYPATPAEIATRFDPSQTALLAEEGGRAIGLAVLHVTPMLHLAQPNARLLALVVDEAIRSGGVGRQLLAAVEARARAAGCPSIELSSNKRRTRAHAFYEAQGYEANSLKFYRRLDP